MRLFEFRNIVSILGKAFYFVKMTIEIHNMDFYKLKHSTFHNCKNMIDTYIPISKKFDSMYTKLHLESFHGFITRVDISILTLIKKTNKSRC